MTQAKTIQLALLSLFCFFIPKAFSKTLKVKKEKIYYGKTPTGQNLYSIRFYKDDHKLPLRPAVLLTGGIHGNEHMGIVEGIADKLNPEDKGFKEFFEAGGVVWFFPEINPNGVEHRNRYNPKGVDLNRDFKLGRKPSQTESAQMLDFLERELDEFGARPILAMDYHCCSTSLIYPKTSKKNSFYQGEFDKVVKLMQTHVDSSYKAGLTKDIFGYETHGTLKAYWFKKYGALSFTYEGAHPTEEKKKLSGHYEWWKDIMSNVTSIYHNDLAKLTPQMEKPKVEGEAPVFYTE